MWRFRDPGLVAALGFAAALTATAAASLPPAEGTQHDARALVAQRCIRCHDLAIVSARHASADEWREIVQRMITNGAEISETEAEAIVSYLATTQGP
jgi:cytochrome c-type biogenesis protein CcmH/NrfF